MTIKYPPDRDGAYGYRERLCSRCREWWPATAEFFARERGVHRRAPWTRWCKACFRERRRMADARRDGREADVRDREGAAHGA